MSGKEAYKFDPEFEKYWEALQKQTYFDDKIIKQFENIQKRLINAIKRAKKPIYSQNTKNIIRRFQLNLIQYLQKELK